MGQKVNPIGLRLGINRTWDSRWYANDRDFAGLLHEDLRRSFPSLRNEVCVRVPCAARACSSRLLPVPVMPQTTRQS